VRPILYSDVQFWPTLLDKLLQINKLLSIKSISIRSEEFDSTLRQRPVIEVVKKVLVELFETFSYVADPSVSFAHIYLLLTIEI
jgi:hypothetical protein